VFVDICYYIAFRLMQKILVRKLLSNIIDKIMYFYWPSLLILYLRPTVYYQRRQVVMCVYFE